MDDSEVIKAMEQKSFLSVFYAISQGNKSIDDLTQMGVIDSDAKKAIDTLLEFDYIRISRKRSSSGSELHEVTGRGKEVIQALCYLPFPKSHLDFKDSREYLGKLLLNLMKTLGGLYEIHWIYNSSSFVNYSKLEDTRMVRKDVEHLSGGLIILYLFSIIEADIRWYDWIRFGSELGISEVQIKLLKAYRHVRHSMSHSSHGRRAWAHKKDFDNIRNMSKEEMGEETHNIIRFRNAIHVTQSDEISIDRIAGMEFHSFLKNLVQKAAARAFNLQA